MSGIGNSSHTSVCGVFVSLFSKGVLITGESGIGKSDLALCLLERGHKLVADDMVEFRLAHDNTLLGSAPSLLKNYLHIRDLGVLDITSLFGTQAVLAEQSLSLIVELEKHTRPSSAITADQDTFSLLDIDIPLFRLSISSNRPVAVLMETLVRNYFSTREGDIPTSQVLLEKHHQLLSTQP